MDILCVLSLRFVIYLSVRLEKSSKVRQQAEERLLSGTWFSVLKSNVFFFKDWMRQRWDSLEFLEDASLPVQTASAAL